VKAAGHAPGPDAYLFPNHRGGRLARQRVDRSHGTAFDELAGAREVSRTAL